MERVSPNHLDVIVPGPGLELRPMVRAHATELYLMVERNRERLREWLPWIAPDYNLASALQFAADSENDNVNRVALTNTIWVDGRMCGAISLHPINYQHRSTSVGYWLAEEFQGRGLMTTACRAMVSHGFSAYALHRLEIRCATGNLRSAAVPQRLAFIEEGVL